MIVLAPAQPTRGADRSKVGCNSEEFAFFSREVVMKRKKLLGPNAHSIFISNIRPQTVPDPAGISHENLANRGEKKRMITQY